LKARDRFKGRTMSLETKAFSKIQLIRRSTLQDTCRNRGIERRKRRGIRRGNSHDVED